MTHPIPEMARFHDVFRAEFEELRKRRARSMLEVVPAELPHPVPSVAHGFTGIALSGGGVRSAVFSLGVLQGLQSKRVIDCADYLSTVSGGGYIGTALTLGMSTNGGVFPFGREADDPGETPEVKHLRDNARYLLPNGMSSAVSALAIYLRGIVMNIIIVLPFLMLASAVLIALNPDTLRLAGQNRVITAFGNIGLPFSLLAALVALGLLALYAVVVSLSPIRPLEQRRRGARLAGSILTCCACVLIVELHPWLLRAAFVYVKIIPLRHDVVGPAITAQFADWLLKVITNAVMWIAPFVVAVLPFIKRLAAKASEDAAGGWSELAKRVASRAVLVFAAAMVPLVLWVVMMQLAYWGTGVSVCSDPNQPIQECSAAVDNWQHAPSFLRSALALGGETDQQALNRFHVPIRYAGAAALILAIAWLVFNVNANSLHQLYRDRLGAAFLAKRAGPKSKKVDAADLFKLTQTNGNAPYHLINTALNVPGSRFANARGRNADFFLFSRCFVGSEATGYVQTEPVERATDGLNIGTAMAISGAAAAPNMGVASMRPLSPTIALLNVRLGRWLRHPADILEWAAAPGRKLTDTASRWFGRPGPGYLLREAFFKSGREITKVRRMPLRKQGFVFLTDGGHIENLGVYELLRRRCALIIAVGGEADPDLDGGSLVQLERFARIDLDIQIDMAWKSIATRTRAVGDEVRKKIVNARRGPHVALGLISYPALHAGGPREKAVLVYIKASLSGDENDYIMAYKAGHGSFPHETTFDQLFSEEQVEVYRALGEHIARRFLDGSDPVAAAHANRAELLDMVRAAIPGATPV